MIGAGVRAGAKEGAGPQDPDGPTAAFPAKVGTALRQRSARASPSARMLPGFHLLLPIDHVQRRDSSMSMWLGGGTP